MTKHTKKSSRSSPEKSSIAQRIEQWLGIAAGSFPKARESIIPLLQAAQSEFGYLPNEVMDAIARFLRVPPAQIQGVASFYAQFRYEAPGKHRVTVCRGTACHVRGSGRVVDELSTWLGIKPQETSKDRLFTLETVACVGSCALAPLMVVDGKVHGRQTPATARKAIEKISMAESEASHGDKEDAV
jgi:NADH-quinone oxidoreductase subunit E